MTVTPTPAPATTGTVLALRGVSKRFGAVQALKNIELDVRAGEVLALVGDNGAGKSTLVKTIAGPFMIRMPRGSQEGNAISRPQKKFCAGVRLSKSARSW